MKFKTLRNIALLGLLACIHTPAKAQSIPEDSTSAVILAYHRIGEDAYPETNLRIEQFAEQVQELVNGNYNIIPLPDLINALKNDTKLPANTVSITFEGAYRSALENAAPILLEHKVPFTIFYASDLADTNSQQYMSWQDLKKMENTKLVTFGLLPAAYVRLSESSTEDILSELNKARSKHRENLTSEPLLFSYPFGEYSEIYKNLIKEQGFLAAFGLQSGVAYAAEDLFSLPRFSITESYGDISRFQMIAQALPLPVTDVEPAYSFLNDNSPAIGFTLPDSLKESSDKLSCFASGVPEVSTEIIGDRRVELRLSAPLQEERSRINCTMPGLQKALDETPSWRWYGMLLVHRSSEDINQEEPALP